MHGPSSAVPSLSAVSSVAAKELEQDPSARSASFLECGWLLSAFRDGASRC
jgi:hypothetical protein